MATNAEITRKHPLAECERCPLYEQSCAPSSGPKDASVAFVSRSPGYYDGIAGKPFAGPSGRVLDHLLEQNGVYRHEILTTNVVLCETDDPPVEAIEACRPRLEAELAQATTILAGGVEAVHELINPRISITAARSRVHYNALTGRLDQRVIATMNPAVVLRESGNFPNMVRDFRVALNPTPEPKLPNVWYTEDENEAMEMLDKLEGQIRLASDLETYGYSPNIACAGFAYSLDLAYVFGAPLFGNAISVGSAGRTYPNFLRRLKELYESDTEFVWHNGKYDVKQLKDNGINARVDADTFLLSYALDERPGGSYQGDQGAGLHALTPTLMEAYGWPDYEYASVKEFKKSQVLEKPLELYDYNGKDTVGTLVLLEDFVLATKADDTYERPYKSYFIPLANSLIDVERRGFTYNVEAACDLNEIHVRPKLKELKQQMRDLCGRALLNPASTQQMKGVYYEHYGLKHELVSTKKDKDKSGSTDKWVRKEVMEDRFECKPGMERDMKQFATLHETFAKVDRSRSNYLEGMIPKVGKDGKLYSTFKFGTNSGRLSSEGPNFQNITRSGSYGIPSMRSLFTASPGHTLINADYSQAELRTIAKLSGDDNLLAIYRDDSRSLHKERATAFYGEGYDKEQYTYAKNMNFGVTYGQSAFAFSQMYGIPLEEAQGYIDAWWRDFPGIEAWRNEVAATATTGDGVIVSPYGHKRRFHLVTRENRDAVIREAVNFLPQNVAGVTTEIAVVRLNAEGIPIVSTVHDSIIADVPQDEAMDVAKRMKEVMEQVVVDELGWQKDDMLFKADISMGNPWSEVEEIDLEAVAA